MCSYVKGIPNIWMRFPDSPGNRETDERTGKRRGLMALPAASGHCASGKASK